MLAADAIMIVRRRASLPPEPLLQARRGAVSLLFAIMLIPMLMMIGLAIDYGMYTQAEAQLDMAADAAAMHAARIAAQLLQQNDPACETKGEAAGAAWFADQKGLVPQSKKVNPPIITVSCSTSATSVTATVNYTGIIIAHFGNLFPSGLPNWPNWGIAGSATAIISNPSYVEVLMLLDNSSSMMIGASQADIAAMEKLTPCSSQAATEGQTLEYDYSWAYTPIGGTYTWHYPQSASSATPSPHNASLKVPYGYGVFLYPALGDKTVPDKTPEWTPEIVPPLAASATGAGWVGQCDYNFSGPAGECGYPGYILNPTTAGSNGGVSPTTGQCVNGEGGKGIVLNAAGYTPPSTFTFPKPMNMPQAPCAFACHSDQTGKADDYWGLAKSATNPAITLRYDVLQNAAGNVISKMMTAPSVSRLSVGVYQFNAPDTANAQVSGMNQVYPAASSGQPFAAAESGPVTVQAQSLTQSVLPPITSDKPDTNFENAMTLLGNFVAPSGAGSYPPAPTKNLFIVTDGMDDYYADPAGQTGRIEAAISPAACEQFKTPVGSLTPITKLPGLGFTVYVLYTKYYPLPNPFYLNSAKAIVEGASPVPGMTNIEYNMSQCASSTDKFYEADDQASINTALQAMLSAALGSAGRLKS